MKTELFWQMDTDSLEQLVSDECEAAVRDFLDGAELSLDTDTLLVHFWPGDEWVTARGLLYPAMRVPDLVKGFIALLEIEAWDRDEAPEEAVERLRQDLKAALDLLNAAFP